MKFSTREDISAPIGDVFAELADFAVYERAMLRRGAEVTRTDDLRTPAAGMAWKSRFTFRGKQRVMVAQLSRYDVPEIIEVTSRSGGLEGVLTVELVQLSPRQTRMQLELDLKPRGLSARLFLQSLRLAKANLTRRFKLGVHSHARSLEERLAAKG